MESVPVRPAKCRPITKTNSGAVDGSNQFDNRVSLHLDSASKGGKMYNLEVWNRY